MNKTTDIIKHKVTWDENQVLVKRFNDYDLYSSNGYKFIIGLNKDIKFNADINANCTNGLYSCLPQDIHLWNHGSIICEVRIPNTAHVINEGTKIRSSELIIVSRRNMIKLDTIKWMEEIGCNFIKLKDFYRYKEHYLDDQTIEYLNEKYDYGFTTLKSIQKESQQKTIKLDNDFWFKNKQNKTITTLKSLSDEKYNWKLQTSELRIESCVNFNVSKKLKFLAGLTISCSRDVIVNSSFVLGDVELANSRDIDLSAITVITGKLILQNCSNIILNENLIVCSYIKIPHTKKDNNIDINISSKTLKSRQVALMKKYLKNNIEDNIVRKYIQKALDSILSNIASGNAQEYNTVKQLKLRFKK